MRIMTSNIWGDYFDNEVSTREDGIFSVFEKYDADVIGLQEITDGWYASNLFSRLAQKYNLVGTELFNNENYTPLAIKKEYEIIASGYERLKDTKDTSKSITWVVAKKNGVTAAFCNTHFWWMNGMQSEADKKLLESVIGEVAYWSAKQHDALRVQNARQMTELMKYLSNRFECSVFAFGDMNTTRDSDAFKVYSENDIRHLWDMAKEKDCICSIHGNPERGDDGKFHGKKTEMEFSASIDHIIGYGESFAIEKYCVVEDEDALDATDHSPVFADISIRKGEDDE